MPKKRFEMRYDFRMSAEDKSEAEVLVYGDITSYPWTDSDVSAKRFNEQLQKVKNEGAKSLRMRINSGGGEVFEAVAIKTMLATCGLDLSVSIEGLCASAATLFTTIPGVPVDIADGSFFMIHNPSGFAYGTAKKFEKEADILRKMEGDFHRMYAEKSGQSEEQCAEWMDAETWFTAREAVQYGFCDQVIETEKAAASVSEEQYAVMSAIYNSVPVIDLSTPIKNGKHDSPTGTAGEPFANNITEGTEDTQTMEIKDITMEQLRDGNRAVYDAIYQNGATAERERISAINDVTPAGYESMAEEAIANGTNCAEFAVNVLKAQRQKGASYIENRAKELEKAKNVTGGAPEDHDDASAKAMEDKEAKEMAAYASACDMTEGMY